MADDDVVAALYAQLTADDGAIEEPPAKRQRTEGEDAAAQIAALLGEGIAATPAPVAPEPTQDDHQAKLMLLAKGIQKGVVPKEKGKAMIVQMLAQQKGNGGGNNSGGSMFQGGKGGQPSGMMQRNDSMGSNYGGSSSPMGGGNGGGFGMGGGGMGKGMGGPVEGPRHSGLPYKICFEFRDKGFCARGALCQFPHEKGGMKYDKGTASVKGKSMTPNDDPNSMVAKGGGFSGGMGGGGKQTGVCFEFRDKGTCSRMQKGMQCNFPHIDPDGNEVSNAPINGGKGDFGNSGGGAAGKVCFEYRDKGSCRLGNNCKFPHINPDGEVVHEGGGMGPAAMNNGPPSRVCFEFRDNGTCRLGANCKFPHVTKDGHVVEVSSSKGGGWGKGGNGKGSSGSGGWTTDWNNMGSSMGGGMGNNENSNNDGGKGGKNNWGNNSQGMNDSFRNSGGFDSNQRQSSRESYASAGGGAPKTVDMKITTPDLGFEYVLETTDEIISVRVTAVKAGSAAKTAGLQENQNIIRLDQLDLTMLDKKQITELLEKRRPLPVRFK